MAHQTISPDLPPVMLFEKRDGIAIITLNRPQASNARNAALRKELIEAFTRVNREDNILVAIVTGSGDRSFSVGLDLKEAAADDMGAISSRDHYASFSDARTLAAVRKPVIAAINGYALGGGLELALCSDIRIASENARFALPEATRGIMPGAGGTQRLPRLIGAARALELMMTGEQIDAQEALRLGLVNNVVPAAELMARAEDLARKLIKAAPLALRFIKEAVLRGRDLPLDGGLQLEADLSTIVSQTKDAREGVLAFAEKRPPNWQGE